MSRQTILVTGCSSGIGRATAEVAARSGHLVVATARDTSTLDGLPPSVLRLRLDVRDAASVAAAVAEADELTGGLTAVVNNAGVVHRGPLELLDDEQLAEAFETNALGPLRVLRAAVPGLRRRGGGTVVNISSLAGRLTTPFLGLYAASKHALEAASDAARLELAPDGIRVVLVEPAAVRTSVRPLLATEPARTAAADPTSPYRDRLRRAAELSAVADRRALAPESVARVVLHAVTAAHPRPRYVVPRHAGVVALARMAPAVLVDRLQAWALDSGHRH
jgi:NAD(P)-dependent dehydrogenase (short-subunit alcohol dehydrogenase family)